MFFVILFFGKIEIMTRTKAAAFYRVAPEKLNCAQCILKAFQTQLNIEDELIATFRKHGGGRAPEGICGALYAVDYLLAQQGKNSVQAEFLQKANAITCLELKKRRKVSCEMCVTIAEKLALEYL